MVRRVVLLFFALMAVVYVRPSSIKAAECYLSGSSSINITARPGGNIVAGETITFYLRVNDDALFIWDDDSPVYIRILRDDGNGFLEQYGPAHRMWRSQENEEGELVLVLVEGILENGTYTAAVYDESSGGDQCSNFLNNFEVTGGEEPPQGCVGIGETCCVNETGNCSFPGNPECCNICEPADPSITLFCDFGQAPPGAGYGYGTVRAATVNDCGFLGLSCCHTVVEGEGRLEILCSQHAEDYDYWSCLGRLVPSTQGPGCTCLRLDPENPPPPPELPENMEVNTAIGCIPIDFIGGTAQFLTNWAIGLAGGVVILLVILGGVMILTSSGNRERLQAGKELLWSAIAGIVMIIFAVFLMRLIGVDILQLPGFGGG